MLNSTISSVQERSAVESPGEMIIRCGDMVHGGSCIARTDSGATVLIDGAIPGELVRVSAPRRRRGTWFAQIIEVVEPSPDRITPPCPYVPTCGGCQLQHVAYERQLALKKDIVFDAMRRQGVTLPEEIRVHGMETPWRYRWRGDFHVVRARGDNSVQGLGFNAVRSWRPIAIDDCLIHHETITHALPALRDAARRGAPQLSTLHLTVGDDGRELLVSARPSGAASEGDLAENAPQPGADTRWTTKATTLQWRGRTFRLAHDSFIQGNQQQMEVLYGLVLDMLGDTSGKRIVDAYAGISILGTIIAEDAREVVCIESNLAAAQNGILNARINGVEERMSYVHESVEVALPRVGAEEIDAVILDPPRSGCDSRVRAWLALRGPAKMVYVSCDPATLARDLRTLVRSGPYEIKQYEIIDMFPHTYHVENAVMLQRS